MTSAAFIQSDDAEWEIVGEGLRRQVLAYEPDLMMVRVDFKRGAVGTPHSHPHRQVSYVAAGAFEVRIEGKRQVLRQGDSFLVSADLEHGAVALEDGTLIDVFTPAREEFLPSRS